MIHILSGGSVKQRAREHSLRAIGERNPIKSSTDLVNFVNEKMRKVTAILVEPSEITEREELLNKRYEFALKVGGCREKHKFKGIPENNTEIEVSEHSYSEDFEIEQVYEK